MQKVGAPKRAPSAFFLFVNANRPLLKERYPGEEDLIIVNVVDAACHECQLNPRTTFCVAEMPNKQVVKTCSDMWKEVNPN